MKFRILVLALAAALLSTSAAFAHDGPGKGKRPPTGPGCKMGKVLLLGTLANDPAADETSFQMTVKKSNRRGRGYVSAAQPVSINVDEKTRIRRRAKGSEATKTLESLAMGDRALVFAKACRGDLRGGGTPELTARFVLARPAPTH
jgi:hypothetical protein